MDFTNQVLVQLSIPESVCDTTKASNYAAEKIFLSVDSVRSIGTLRTEKQGIKDGCLDQEEALTSVLYLVFFLLKNDAALVS